MAFTSDGDEENGDQEEFECMKCYAKGEFNLIRELRILNNRFQSYFRLDKNQFDVLLEKIKPLISKMDTGFHRRISPDECLAIHLR